MKFLKRKIIPLLRKKRYSIPAIILLVVILIALNATRNNKPQFETRQTVRTTVEQLVSVTGTVQSAEAVDLAFERGGKLAPLELKVGDKVTAGMSIAHLSNADLSAQVQSAAANLSSQVIKLEQMRKGARPEAQAVSDAELQSAETTFNNAELGLVDKVNDAFVKADDAVHNYADKLFRNPDTSPTFGTTIESDGVTYNINTNDFSLRSSLGSKRRALNNIFELWSIVSNTSSGQALAQAADTAEKNLLIVQDFLNAVALAVNNLSTDDATANTVYESFKSDISTARASANTALTSLRTALQTYNSSKGALDLATKQNTLNTAPSSYEDLKIQEAQVSSAQASLDSARAELGKTIITAPTAGVITKINADPGEIVPANTTAVSLIGEATLEIEAFIPEADIAKVHVGAESSVTFDAYGNDLKLTARVISTEPAETVIDGVPTYKTILAFDSPDERIKSGMTANVEIKGDYRQNAIAVPSRAITTRDGKKYVRILVNGKAEERQVTTGLRGSDGNTEIVTGLAEGDMVITSTAK